ncbi:MAG: DUF560 domain-containing protein [Moraxellaceae bacterium]|nr:DUF560 domain-containing protein [Moraxellaceae bacterium]
MPYNSLIIKKPIVLLSIFCSLISPAFATDDTNNIFISSNKNFSEPTFQDELGSPDITIADTKQLLEIKKSKNPQPKVSKRRMTRKETLAYLSKHPQELEFELAKMIKVGNLPAIKDYLPLYKNYDKRDESIVEWAEAILAQNNGDLAKAISVFRNLNSKFPNIRVLRFHMVSALMKDGQYNAALSELKKMRSYKEALPEERQGIENLINAIENKDQWSFYLNANYVNDNNITNSPKEGTDYGNGWKAGARKSGKGFKFNTDMNKQWNYDNKLFTEFDFATYGTYYVDNKNYNEVTAQLGAGLGYKKDDYKIKIMPNYSRNFYGMGENGDENLHNYKTTLGADLEFERVLDNKSEYNATFGYNHNKFVDDYKNNDSDDYSLSQTLSYNYSPLTYFYGGADYFKRNSVLDYSSFNRKGVRLGWGQIWPKGFTTRANIGYAIKRYEAPDFFGDKRVNDEYSAGLSVWNRQLHFLGLTPRVNWRYQKTDSNSVREEVTKNDVFLSVTKSF